ncbi:hypothetical protein BKA70DRAFT_1278578 [Coprinopsis sp. MPI-PUGE-AT-0042]|nr:hypothetical protein BKA70DRAFT_1278578 [Coprinopsis sp. MPI-PUGE-AT-0042]
MDAVSKTGKSGTLGEITNGSARMRSESRGSVRGRTESAKYDKQDGGLLKPKEDDKKWWNLSIGRSRKDSKDERKEENIQAGRGRFNSLDAGMLLGLSSKKSNGDLDRAASPVPPPQRKGSMPMPSIIVAEPSPAERDFKSTMAPPPPMARSTSLPLGHDALLAYSAKASTPTTSTLLAPLTINGGLAPPVEEHMLGGKDNQGSIALRAMRSVRSFTRIGAWASGDGANEEVKKDGTVKEKKSKSKSKKDKEAVEGDGTIRKKSKKDKKESKKEKAKGEEEKEVKTKESAVRLSTSSFEAGALTSSPAPPPRSQPSLGIYGHKSSTRNGATVNSAFLSASNAYPETSTPALDMGTTRTLPSVSTPTPANLTIGKSKGKKAKKEKSDKAKSSDEATGNKDTISKKHSILGLGLPSSMRLGGRGRQGSSASSLFKSASDKVEGGKQFGATIIPPASSTRLSVDSCAPAERRASINSTTSSLRPISVTSSISGASTADSRRVSKSSSLGVGSILAGRQHRTSTQSKKSTGAGSIRWDDGVLEREKEKVRRESLESTMRRESMDSRRASGESTRRSSLDPKQKEEARRRTALGDVFPELASAPGSRRTSGVSEDGAASKGSSRSSTSRDGRFKYPILTIEEATNDGHSVDDRSLHGYDRGSSGDYEYPLFQNISGNTTE